MAKCKCESRIWRRIRQKPKGRGVQYRLVCLACEWEWWSSAAYTSDVPWITEEERRQLSFPGE